jgi:hypothetical protein
MIPLSLQLFQLQNLDPKVVIRPLGQVKTVVRAGQAGVVPTGPVHFKWV